jgi:hypothetical protein
MHLGHKSLPEIRQRVASYFAWECVRCFVGILIVNGPQESLRSVLSNRLGGTMMLMVMVVTGGIVRGPKSASRAGVKRLLEACLFPSTGTTEEGSIRVAVEGSSPGRMGVGLPLEGPMHG